MNTISTRRPLWPRIKARVKAWYLRQLIESHEREAKAMEEALDAIPFEHDSLLGCLATLRVQLALCEKET